MLASLDDDSRWDLIIRLTRYNRRAFLGSILKTMASLPLPIGDNARLWAADMTVTDRHKTLLALLPKASTPDEVTAMLSIFGIAGAAIGHGHDIDYLLAAATPPAYFVLLGYMRRLEHDRAMLTAITRRAMQRADTVSFNAASLFKVFFDLTDVRGTFSLRIHPYELGRLEHDYALFRSRISPD